MSDKRLRELGADCVCGDLILNRVTVGHYRNGQFVVTPEGAEVLEADKAKPAAKSPAAPAPAPKPGRAPKAAKDKPAETTEPVADAPADTEPASDPVGDLTAGLDDLLNS